MPDGRLALHRCPNFLRKSKKLTWVMYLPPGKNLWSSAFRLLQQKSAQSRRRSAQHRHPLTGEVSTDRTTLRRSEIRRDAAHVSRSVPQPPSKRGSVFNVETPG